MANPEKIPAGQPLPVRSAVFHPAAPAPPPQPHPPIGLVPVSSTQVPHPVVPPKVTPPSAVSLSGNNLRRTLATVDPIGTSAEGLENSLNPFRLAGSQRVFGALQQIQQHTSRILQALKQPKLPPKLVGALHQPDGSAAARVQVQFQPSSVGVTGSAEVVLTADDGGFTVSMPPGAVIPDTGLSLTVHGANSNTTVDIPANQIAANGMIGVIFLSITLSALPVSILAALQALIPPGPGPQNTPPPPPKKKHCVTIGEPGSTCIQSFFAGETVDRFPWGLFFRIIEPQMSIVTQTQEVEIGPEKYSWMPIFGTERKLSSSVASKFVDRVPVDQPLSVDGFRDQISGVGHLGIITEDETVPMAASLGLGYVLRMSQQWTLQGLGLGDLVYSLPLAPGEQQQVAVFERRDTSSVQESESFSQSEAMSQSAVSDTSTTATFNSAFKEMVNGSSSFFNDSTSSSSGIAGGIGPIAASGGSGSSTSIGSSSSSLSGTRDTTAQATQATHSSAENQASARVTANRTGMRLATGSENMSVTTKTITNHNHTRALTMQYWQVLRMYDVTTVIEGLTLVCLVPMQIVRFMPPGQAFALADGSTINTHDGVLKRYGGILRHLDVLLGAVPRQFRHGLNLLAQLAADPTIEVDSSGGSAETVIHFELDGTFLSCERVSIMAVTNRNTRVGPVQLAPKSAGSPSPIPQDKFMTRDELIAWLSTCRNNPKCALQGSLALPPSVNRSDIVGFEISRQYMTVHYPLTSPAKQASEQMLTGLVQGKPDLATFISMTSIGSINPPTVSLDPADMEPLLGGPALGRFYAAIEDFKPVTGLAPRGSNPPDTDVPSPQETYANDNFNDVVLPPQPFPVPARQLASTLRYQDVLQIEKAAQHVMRNTTRYSKAVWLSMTPEESAILLDGYTIGVPPGGLADAGQMIPLLNCLQNVILGTFGNSLIMPFIIPADLAEQLGIDPGQLQEALLAYQRDAFVAPHSTVAHRQPRGCWVKPCSVIALPPKGLT